MCDDPSLLPTNVKPEHAALYRRAADLWREAQDLGLIRSPQATLSSYGYKVTRMGGFQFYEDHHWHRLISALSRMIRRDRSGDR